MRFAVADTLREHDERWIGANGLQGRKLPPQLQLTPQQQALRQSWRDIDGEKKAFVTALALIQENSHFIGKEINSAEPGDLLFFDQGDEQHLMIWMDRYIAYHTGTVTRTETVFLRDPDRKVPFPIVNEGTQKRYLTGADFDIESIQPIGDAMWFGDELGPYLLKTDRQGKVLAVFETRVDGKVLKSPDHFSVTTPATSGSFTTVARRSRGYEGMAASPDGQFLYPLLEGPLWNADEKKWEHKDGREYLRILEFSVAKGEWTGRSWKYALEQNGNNIGDFNMIDAETALIIERDNGEGLPEHACNGPARPDCQNVPARFKRVYKVSLKDADADGFVKKIGHIDLLDIRDPQQLARRGGKDGKFSFPFVTIEDVDVVDGEHIIVANDNNLPYSAARQPNLQDDNEFILLHAPELLKAR